MTEVDQELADLTRHLCRYLYDAGRVDRLIELIADDRWMLRRRDPVTDDWDGYQADLETIWDAVDQSSIADPTPYLIRLAVIRSTLSSDEDLPPALVLAARSTDAWSVKRTLSAISRQPSSTLRAAMLLTLLEDVGSEQSDSVRARILDLIQLPAGELPAEELVRGLELLEPAERLAVVDRIAADAIITSVAQRVGTVTPAAIVDALEAVPEARRPVLIRKVADRLILELAPSARSAEEPDDRAEQEPGRLPSPPSLRDQQYQDAIKVRFDLSRASRDVAELLVRLAAFLPLHPAPQDFLQAVGKSLGFVTDPNLLGRLMEAYALPGPAESLKPSEDGSPDEESRARRDLLRSVQAAVRPGEVNELLGTDDLPGDSIEILQWRYLNLLLPKLNGPDEAPDYEPSEGGAADYSLVMREIRRLGMPTFLATMVSREPLSDADLLKLVRETMKPSDLAEQLFMMSLINELREDEVQDAQITQAQRRIRAALLIAALDRHVQEGSVAAAWLGVRADDLVDVDWNAVLAHFLALSLDPQRTTLDLVYGTAIDIRTAPRLAALPLLLPHLIDDQVSSVFTDVLAWYDSDMRRAGLELLAPRLTRQQVDRALRSLAPDVDAVSQLWAIEALTTGINAGDLRLLTVDEWYAQTITDIRSGQDFGLAARLISRPVGEQPDKRPPPGDLLPAAQLLGPLRSMTVPHRLDALLALARATAGRLPPKIVAEALALPTAGDNNKISPRGWLIAMLADRFPDEWIERVFVAALELPERNAIGDSQAWGWNWIHEYPRGAAILALAPRLTGDQATAAFEECKRLPWFAREEITRALAAVADERLARLIFDHALHVHPDYMSLPDSVSGAYVLEQTVVMSELAIFKIEREVQLAEVIAATVDRLDQDRLDRAVAQALAFTNDGPRAWLPARLLPHLPRGRIEPLLSSGALAAIEFVGADPGRLDLLTDLLPAMEDEIARRSDAVQNFVERHAHERRERLTRAEYERLTADEAREYERLLGADAMAEASAAHEWSAQVDQRPFVLRSLLSPVFAGQLENILVQTLAQAPLRPRVRAIESMREVVEPEQRAAIVSATMRQLIEQDLDPMKRVQALGELLPLLDQAAVDALVSVAAVQPGPSIRDDEELAAAIAAMTVRDFGKVTRSHPGFDEFRHNLVARIVEKSMSDQDLDVIRERRGARVQLLDHAGPRLSATGMIHAVELVCSLPPVERGDGIAALLPVASGPNRDRLVAELIDLPSAFGRFWGLFNAQDALGEPSDPRLPKLARETALSFADPRSSATLLLMLIGYSGDDREDWILEAARRLERLPAHERLSLLSLIARMAQNNERLTAIFWQQTCGGPSLDDVFAGLLVAARLGVSTSAITDSQRQALRDAVTHHLRSAARSERARLLAFVAGEAPGLMAMSSPEGGFEAARAVHEVCSLWRW
ncbi:hypothetical protein I6A60_26665 [Frankia sp. AgB1.9]|uniref:hypothetical protein n=1 Tax=unclassified Frankia TaxID=2632575 RepID=UPI0019331C40|nr:MULTISPECIES: hypothetical protein [unclassified Frankia]MBL7488606.1 hypothetical protein [Frankia sp. AgW1.1]MBL7551416.1 hypothetical protein [Frankia sp. AgB1.9]MBL7622668.1 hypothetical protein [Frankia sp. AgB1.8]